MNTKKCEASRNQWVGGRRGGDRKLRKENSFEPVRTLKRDERFRSFFGHK